MKLNARPLLALLAMPVALFLSARSAAPARATAVGARASTHSLPEFDVLRGVRGTTLTLRASAAARGVASGVSVRYDALTGAASRVASSTGALSEPTGAAPETAARQYLGANPALFQLAAADVSALVTTRDMTDDVTGVTHLTLEQQVNGIPVVDAVSAVNVDSQGRVISVANGLVPQVGATVNAAAPLLTQAQALVAAARFAGVTLQAATPATDVPTGARQAQTFSTGSVFTQAPVVQLTYVPTAPGQTTLAWETTIATHSTPDVYNVMVDAATGALLYRHNYTVYASPQGLVYDREAPQDGTPYLGSDPPVISRVTKPFDGSAFFSTGDPHFDWWASSAPTSTQSNNTFCAPDRPGANDGNPVTSATSDFSFNLDLSLDPKNYQPAATTNLFYWVNLCHDTWYNFGFNEKSNNFQATNFNLGGTAGDPVLAFAQAGANIGITDNADFTTQPDGIPGLIHMYVWDLTVPQRDGDLASDIICHEYCHGVSNRLVGNARGLRGFQSVAMGEGWGDFSSLMIHADPADNLDGEYPLGGYVLGPGQFSAGIRSQPYSTDPNVYSRTYANIDDDAGGGFGPEVHLAGEIMCNALWKTYARMAKRLGFATGRTRMMQLFIDAFKMGPQRDPTYLDYRDALIKADKARYLGNDVNDIWIAFASMGMGVNATTTGANDTKPKENFETPIPTFAIAGTVTENGKPVSGVLMAAGAATALTKTDGTYILDGLPADVYTVTPTKATYTFQPNVRQVTVGPNQTGVDFVGVRSAYVLAGVVSSGGQGVEGVTISAGSASAITASNGSYSMSLKPGTYVVTAQKAEYTFAPATLNITLGPDRTDINFTATVKTYRVTGTVRSSGSGLSGVTVSAGGQSSTTGADGSYTLVGLTANTYDVAVSKAGYLFTPSVRTITVGPSQSGIDFNGAPAFSISGKIVKGGVGFGGVLVSVGSATTTTNTDGSYSLSGLVAGNYTVTPSLAETSFTPANRVVSLGPDTANVNFTGKDATYAVTGHIRSGGQGLAGIVVSAGQQLGTSVADGSYTINGLTAGTYAVAAISEGFLYVPNYTLVTVGKGASASGIDFNVGQKYRLAGVITQNNVGLGGVTFTLGKTTVTTAADGSYAFSDLPAGTYTLVPTKAETEFSPASLSVNLGPSKIDANFTAATKEYVIGGRVTVTGGEGVAGVTVSAGNLSAQTDAGGNYSITGVRAGTYTVAATKASYSFLPATRTITVGPSTAAANFTATALTYAVAGRITLGAAGVSAVTVTAGDKTTQTAADGTYSFTGLSAGPITVTPVKSELAFTPASQSFTLSADRNDVNFAASVQAYSIRGTVRANDGPLAGVVVSVSPVGKTAVTGADGTYTIDGLAKGAYVLAATKTGYRFGPTSLGVTVGPSALGADFTGTKVLLLTGKVTLGVAPVAGVRIQANSLSTLTLSDGTYLFNDVAAGSYTVTAQKDGMVFSPATATATLGPDSATVNFSAARVFRATGRVLTSGTPVAGVTVKCGALTSVTAGDGTFVFDGLVSGSYTFQPQREGFSFTPAYRTVRVDADVSEINFSAAPPPALVSIAVSPAEVKGGKSVTGKVTLSGPVLVATVVAITSNAAVATYPGATVTVAPGASQATFTIQTRKVTAKKRVTLTASLGDQTRSTELVVKP